MTDSTGFYKLTPEELIFCELEQLEKLTGVRARNLAKYFRGKHSMTQRQADRLAAALRMTRADFDAAIKERTRICKAQAAARESVKAILVNSECAA